MLYYAWITPLACWKKSTYPLFWNVTLYAHVCGCCTQRGGPGGAAGLGARASTGVPAVTGALGVCRAFLWHLGRNP